MSVSDSGLLGVQDGIAVLDDLLLDALEGLQVQAQLDTGVKNKGVRPVAMKVYPCCQQL